MRCFLAVDIPKDVKEKCGEVQQELKKTNGDIKFVEYENLHLTVKFYGEVPKKNLDRIVDRVEEKLKPVKPIKTKFKNLGAFPNENFIKVIWVGVEIQNGLMEKFNKNSPHLTIARVKSRRNKEKIQKKLQELKDIYLGEMVIDELALFKSELTSAGPKYTKIKNFRLV